MNRIALFADVQNIYYTTREAYGKQFNYRELWRRVAATGIIVSATAYAIQRHDDKQIKFQDVLKHIGFEVKLKPYIQRSDGSSKGDWDVGIAVDIMEAAQAVDTVILLKRIQSKYGVNTIVYGVPSLTANSLIESANIYQPIESDLLM